MILYHYASFQDWCPDDIDPVSGMLRRSPTFTIAPIRASNAQNHIPPFDPVVWLTTEGDATSGDETILRLRITVEAPEYAVMTISRVWGERAPRNTKFWRRAHKTWRVVMHDVPAEWIRGADPCFGSPWWEIHEQGDD